MVDTVGDYLASCEDEIKVSELWVYCAVYSLLIERLLYVPFLVSLVHTKTVILYWWTGGSACMSHNSRG